MISEDAQVPPPCAPPELKPLQQIRAVELWEKTGHELYRDLQLREAQIVSWALEMEVMIQELCRQP